MADNKNNPNEVPDTGHEWDGIRELTNPPPRWWINALYLSGLFVLVYFILYPSIPLIHGSTKGLLGWTEIKEYKKSLAKVQAERKPYEEKLKKMTVDQILADPEMRNYAVASSKVLFGDNCAACHGAGGVPTPGSGFPILADNDWLYGGTVDDIEASIAEGRHGMMPSHIKILKPKTVDRLVKFVINSSNGVKDTAGLALFKAKGCTACHGEHAQGNQEIGSANLTDKIWRFSGKPDQIRYTIEHGVNDPSDPKTRIAVMPTWNEKLAKIIEAKKWGDKPDLTGKEKQRLTITQVKKLAVYVHQLGGGQ